MDLSLLSDYAAGVVSGPKDVGPIISTEKMGLISPPTIPASSLTPYLPGQEPAYNWWTNQVNDSTPWGVNYGANNPPWLDSYVNGQPKTSTPGGAIGSFTGGSALILLAGVGALIFFLAKGK